MAATRGGDSTTKASTYPHNGMYCGGGGEKNKTENKLDIMRKKGQPKPRNTLTLRYTLRGAIGIMILAAYLASHLELLGLGRSLSGGGN